MIESVFENSRVSSALSFGFEFNVVEFAFWNECDTHESTPAGSRSDVLPYMGVADDNGLHLLVSRKVGQMCAVRGNDAWQDGNFFRILTLDCIPYCCRGNFGINAFTIIGIEVFLVGHVIFRIRELWVSFEPLKALDWITVQK